MSCEGQIDVGRSGEGFFQAEKTATKRDLQRQSGTWRTADAFGHEARIFADLK